MNQFAKNLKDYRKIRKLTQTELAEKLGLTKQSIINYEKGMTFPTGKRLNDLIEILEVTPEQLLGKEMFQLPEEKTMLDLCRKKSEFVAWYQHAIEEDYDYEIMTDELYAYLERIIKNLNNDEIYYAICTILDNRINSAQSNYIGEMANNLLDTPCIADDDLSDMDLP